MPTRPHTLALAIFAAIFAASCDEPPAKPAPSGASARPPTASPQIHPGARVGEHGKGAPVGEAAVSRPAKYLTYVEHAGRTYSLRTRPWSQRHGDTVTAVFRVTGKRLGTVAAAGDRPPRPVTAWLQTVSVDCAEDTISLISRRLEAADGTTVPAPLAGAAAGPTEQPPWPGVVYALCRTIDPPRPDFPIAEGDVSRPQGTFVRITRAKGLDYSLRTDPGPVRRDDEVFAVVRVTGAVYREQRPIDKSPRTVDETHDELTFQCRTGLVTQNGYTAFVKGEVFVTAPMDGWMGKPPAGDPYRRLLEHVCSRY
jgi:hypothetical protein